ncbi:MAG: hypothetical protein ACM3IL_02195 [Deltaproteobacteria bacterium]
MSRIGFDFNNLFSFNVGLRHGVSIKELFKMSPAVEKAHRHLAGILAGERNRVRLNLEWAKLPFQSRETIDEIQKLGRQISSGCDNVVFLGIGGSFLGLKAAQDALCPPYYNEFDALRKRKPRIYFEGNNLDPDTLHTLLEHLNPRKTFLVVISKSGETTEPKAAFMVAQDWLKKYAGQKYGRQIVVITDPESGTLRRYVQEQQKKDRLSFRSLPLLKGVGGRFSEFNMGLLHLAIVGVDITRILEGAKAMFKRCSSADIFKNPAYMYAATQLVLCRKKGKSIAVMMPFSETLKSTADWYVQLLAESLGKKYGRKVSVSHEGIETWSQDLRRAVNTGITPVSSRGTNDLHSIQQNNIEGRNDKIITFIKVENFQADIAVPGRNDALSGKKFSWLMHLAQEATEWALVRESRPNCTIVMPKVDPYHWGELIFFFEMAVAFEGELLNLNAFDQPGVEGYKNYMYYKLKKPGLTPKIIQAIRTTPLRKKKKFIL